MGKKTILLTVSVEQAGYEAGFDGTIECKPVSIRVALIRVVKHVTGKGLGDSKNVIDNLFGTKVTGRATLDFLTDDAGIGRLATLIYNQDELTGEHSRFEIIGIRSIGNGVIQ